MRKRGVLIITVVTGIFLATAFVNPSEKYFEIAKNLDIFATLFKEVNAFYVDEVEPDQLIRKGIDAMLESLDPYTDFIAEDEIESFRTMTTGQYAGIGALIGNHHGKVVITMPYEGFAAERAGLRIGDQIVAIDGVKVNEKKTSEISKMLKGQAKTNVSITIKRYGVEEDLTLTFERERIKVSNVPYHGLLKKDIGYIRLEDFTVGAGKEVAKAVTELKEKGAKKLILDLRGNPGGLLSEAVNVSNVFIPKGKEVVSTKGKVKEWNKSYKTLNGAVDTKTPLIVLIDGGSASAAEIVSGVVQDYDRGVLIGRKTFGKGLVQTTRPLSYNSQLKVTTAKYYIPSGRCIQALDYSHRNEDGSVDRVPDSLKSEFKTKNGRVVYDGGGLDPDLMLKEQYLAPITASLISKGLIFDYATIYCHRHSSIPTPKDFVISEEDYKDFTAWVEDKDYQYNTQSERLLNKLESSAKEDLYYDHLKVDILALKNKLKENKTNDLQKFENQIRQVLKQEIASRYFLRQGEIESSFSYDHDLRKAVSIFSNAGEYDNVLMAN